MRRSLVALSVALLLAGCTPAPSASTTPASSVGTPASSAGTPAASPSVTPSDTPVATPSANLQVVEISLKNGKVTPSGERVAVDKGTVLQLRITSDREDEIHVHGYEVEIKVKPGAEVTREITLDQVGRFEVESHEPALTILQLVVS